MRRSCDEKPILFNDDVEGPTLIAHYRSCQKDLCNSGDGLQYSEGSIDGNGNGGIGGILVPDRAAAESMMKINIFLLGICGLILSYFRTTGV